MLPGFMATLPPLGASASLDKLVTAADVDGFAAISLDTNPVHLDEDYARTSFAIGYVTAANAVATSAAVPIFDSAIVRP